MESQQDGSRDHDGDRNTDAREALSALASDRAALADRVATPRWYYPLLGAATALIIGSPGAGNPGGQSMMVAFACVGIVFLTMAYQKKTGVTISRTAGPRSLGVAITMGVVIILLLGASFALAATDQRAWIGVTALTAFATMWIGGIIYDHAYLRELRRGR
ncbi:hypothetical protein GCM10027416_28310 [Okibacterium endophyticum]